MPLPFSTRLFSALILVGKETGVQFFGLFGLLFISGLMLTLISRWTNNSFRQFMFPKFGLYLFGIIGVPIHELCHAVFAKIFFHDIERIKWFDPKGSGGSYGTVVHRYNDNNLYHRIGLFFIGLGPVLLAPLILWLGYLCLVPDASTFAWGARGLSAQALEFARSLIDLANWRSVGFYLFLYLTVCLTSQMELSPDDLKIARGGVWPILLLLLLVNTLAFAFNLPLHGKLVHGFHSVLALWGTWFVAALVISVVNLVLCVVLLNLFHRLFGKNGINPFRN